MISFILSLSMVDLEQRRWRLSQHASASNSGSWLHPEPYQDSQDSIRQQNEKPAARNDAAFRGWYTRKKHRAMAKMQFSDALEMRKRVVVGLFFWGFLGVWGIAYVAKRMYGWIFET